MKGITSHIGRMLCAIGVVAAVAATARADVIGVSGSLGAKASDGIGTATDSDAVGAMPFTLSQVAISGNAEHRADSAIDYDFMDGGNASFGFYQIAQNRGVDIGSYAQTSGSVDFSIGGIANMSYLFDGAFDQTGIDQILLHIVLTDLTSSTVVFENLQESRTTADQSFVLGGQAGDFANALTGGLGGTLIVGHDYRLDYFFGIKNLSDTVAADASGFMTLSIVPAPGAILLGAIGIAMLLARRGAIG